MRGFFDSFALLLAVLYCVSTASTTTSATIRFLRTNWLSGGTSHTTPVLINTHEVLLSWELTCDPTHPNGDKEQLGCDELHTFGSFVVEVEAVNHRGEKLSRVGQWSVASHDLAVYPKQRDAMWHSTEFAWKSHLHIHSGMQKNEGGVEWDALGVQRYRWRVQSAATAQSSSTTWSPWSFVHYVAFSLPTSSKTKPGVAQQATTISGEGDDDLVSQWVERNTTENLFRTVFEAPATFVTATLLISGVGAFDAFLNGVRTNDHVLDPGTTDFAAFSLVTVDDVTHLLQAGVPNVLGVMLGNGWYGMPLAYNQTPKLRFELIVDNATVAVSTPSTVHMHAGPITYDDIYNGETYECDADVPGWNLASFDASTWRHALPTNATAFQPAMVPRNFPPIRVNETLEPVNITLPVANTMVIDFGREISGVCSFTVKYSSPGAAIFLHHGEIMDHYDPGMADQVYFANLRSAKALDTFVGCTNLFQDRNEQAATSVITTIRPRFTYHGFRFVQINWTGNISLVEIRAHAFFTDVQPVSTFTSSYPLLNKLHQHVLWGQTANLMSYPTDCDQRDERLGWMADGWLSSDEATGNFGMHEFYRNWVSIMLADQVLGMVGDVTPFVRFGGRPADPTWGLALPYVASVVWREYGDVGALEEFYNATMEWWEFLHGSQQSSGFASMYASYGDWVPPPPVSKVSDNFVSGFSLLYATQLQIDMALALNFTNDVMRLSQQLQSYLEEFNGVWFNVSTNWYANGVQTSYVLPMAILGLVPFEVAIGLLEEVEGERYHLDTGIVGTRFLFDSLTALGHTDTALEVVLQETYPGYAFEWSNTLETPATTLWEVWDAPLEGPGMNSRNHIMDGSVDTWLHRRVGGLTQAASSTAYRRLVLRSDAAACLSPVRSGGVRRISPRHAVEAAAATEPHLEKPGRAGAAATMAHEWVIHGGHVCEKAAAGRSLQLSCGSDGGVMDLIEFASVGKPTGVCSGYVHDTPCHTNRSLLEELQERCVGKQACEVSEWWLQPDVLPLEADRQTAEPTGNFGRKVVRADSSPFQCVATTHLVAAVRVRCSKPRSYRITVDLPSATTAELFVPQHLVRAPRLTMESSGSLRYVSSTRTSSHRSSPTALRTDEEESVLFGSHTFELGTSDHLPGHLSVRVDGQWPFRAPLGQSILQTSGGGAPGEEEQQQLQSSFPVASTLVHLHNTAGIPAKHLARVQHDCFGRTLHWIRSSAGATCQALLTEACRLSTPSLGGNGQLEAWWSYSS